MLRRRTGLARSNLPGDALAESVSDQVCARMQEDAATNPVASVLHPRLRRHTASRPRTADVTIVDKPKVRKAVAVATTGNMIFHPRVGAAGATSIGAHGNHDEVHARDRA